MATRRSNQFDPHLDPALLQLVEKVASGYEPYDVEFKSGYRPGDKRFHGRGSALDFNLVDRANQTALADYQSPETAQAYQQFANAVYSAADPELQKKLRWGGYFSGGKGQYGALDLMHLDVGGDTTPMAGGSWAEGFNPEQMKTWGLQQAGGIGAAVQQMSAAGYSPEQIRNAIASIESAGSGDYGALGAWTGDPENGRDRAYGRYQVMGANIPQWTNQALGKSMTPDEFLADKSAQDAVFDKIFGGYISQYGNRGAASKWFTGSEKEPNRTDVNGKLTGGTYADRFEAALGQPTGGGGTAVASTGATGATDPAAMAALAGKYKSPQPTIEDAVRGAASAMGKGTKVPQMRDYQMAQVAPKIMPASPVVDPAQAEQRRQALAVALQRLNGGGGIG